MDETFGRYTLIRRLAVGGMAEIFLAALHGDAGFEKKVVVKRILPHLSADACFVKMFIDEAVVAARLSHPNIIQTHDFGVVDGNHYITMEYVEGVDLNRLLSQGKALRQRLLPAQVAALGERIAGGLAYTHNLTDDAGASLGIVHRDISPHNIMISFAGEIKVMDFGIAKAAARATQTAAGTIKGKLAYMAPEQAAGQPATKHSDQYALGVVLWECLSGERLFVSDSEIQLIQRVKTGDVTPLRSLRDDVPEALEAIVMRALHKDPAARYDDLQHMHDDLMAFRYSLGADGMVQLGPLARACERDTAGPSASWSWAQSQQVAASHTRPLATARPRVAKTTGVATDSEPHLCHQVGRWPDNAQSASVSPNSQPHGAQAAVAATEIGHTPARTLRGLLTPSMPKRPMHIAHRLRRKARPAHKPVLKVRRRWRVPCALAALTISCFGVIFWHQSVVANHIAALHAPQVSMTALRMIRGHKPQTGRLSLSYEGHEVDVYLGQHCLGTTPLANEVVPAGRLALRLVNEAAGITQCYEINVPAGGSARGCVTPMGLSLPQSPHVDGFIPGQPQPLRLSADAVQPSAT
jgi:serine/threonine-protein kinase